MGRSTKVATTAFLYQVYKSPIVIYVSLPKGLKKVSCLLSFSIQSSTAHRGLGGV